MTERDRDEDAAWRSIIEHYGDRPELPEDEPPAGPVESPSGENRFPSLSRRWPGATAEPPPPVEPAGTDPYNSPATWDDEGHFVPPDPPLPPQPEGWRKWAWIGLFGSPTVLLIAAVVGIDLWDWVLFGLAASFVAGFVYLVATMNRKGPDDWSGDNGAVV